jgi:hypothetical protein
MQDMESIRSELNWCKTLQQNAALVEEASAAAESLKGDKKK